jgi:hypothetical protein
MVDGGYNGSRGGTPGENAMPVHDWTRVDAGIFHAFHHEWISEIGRALNRGLLPPDYYALPEQIAGGLGPDVLTLERPPQDRPQGRRPSTRRPKGTVALADSPPRIRFRISDAKKWYATKKKAVTIRHISEHNVVAVLEILSPGNKSSRDALAAFTFKAHQLLAAGIHFAAIDLFPPTRRDPEGIHPILWSDEDEGAFEFDPAKPLTCASYVSAPLTEAFVEPVGVGDKLPDLPLFLTAYEYVPAPLETTYEAAFDAVPEFWREALAGPSPKRKRQA